jgi:hypothetical protein
MRLCGILGFTHEGSFYHAIGALQNKRRSMKTSLININSKRFQTEVDFLRDGKIFLFKHKRE